MFHRPCFLALAVLSYSAAAFASTPSIALAQSTQPAQNVVPAQSLSNFDPAFHALSEQAHVTILAEGRPLHLALSEGDLAALEASLANADTSGPSANLAPGLSISNTIAKIAEAYDYTAEKVNTHLYLLHKRYTDIHDLPCVTYEELLNSVRQMERLCSQNGEHRNSPGSYSLPELVYQSLTPEQVKKAETGIAIGELTAEQQQLAQTAAVELGIGEKIVQIQQTDHHLTALKNPKTVFSYFYALNAQAFGYRGPIAVQGGLGERALDNRFYSLSSGYSRPNPTTPKTETHIEADLGPDPTRPTDEDRRALRESQEDKSPYRMTLGALAQAITTPDMPANATAASAASATHATVADLPGDRKKPLRFTVDVGLGSKVVSSYGLKYSSSDAVIRALASLYRLTLLVPKERRYAIALATASDRADLSFSAKIAELIPLPLQRARDRQAALASVDVIKNDKFGSSEMVLRQNARRSVSNVYYYPADHRLLLLAKPLVPTPDSPPVPLSRADPDVYRLIALMIYSSSCIATVDQLVDQPLPVFLEHPEALVLQMKLTKTDVGTESTKAVFGYRDEKGEYHAERATYYSHQTTPSTGPAASGTTPTTPK